MNLPRVTEKHGVEPRLTESKSVVLPLHYFSRCAGVSFALTSTIGHRINCPPIF